MGIDSQIDVKPDIGLLNATTPGPPGHPPLEDEGMRRSSTAPQSILPLKRQRSMALGPKGRKRTVSQVVPETSRTVSNSSSKASPKSRCTVTRTSGKVPTLNSLFTRVVDVVQDAPDQEPRAYMYIYGGSKDVSEMTHIPTNDFYRLDLQTLVWEDLTGVFKECLDAEDPFSRQLLAHGLPYLDNPTSTLYRRGQRRFMLIFGGADVSGTPTNELISVDLERQTWERIRTRLLLGHATVTVAEGDFVLPRAGAGSIVVDDKLFIFGGWTMLKGKGKGKGKRGKGVAETVDAFSVLDLTTRVWLVRDRRYPPHVGSLGYNIDVYAPDVFKGCKLLLMRGKVDDTEPVRFAGDFMHLFNTKTFTFTTQAYEGSVPPDHTWFDVSPHRSSDRVCAVYGSIDVPNAEELPSDLWMFNVLSDEWTCAGLRQELWDLDLDLQTLEHVPGKGWCLFGYKQAVARKKRAKPSANVLRTWNVCVMLDIPDEGMS